MSSLAEKVADFKALLEGGQLVEAIQRYYADEVNVFENRELARAGKRQCLEFEQEQVSKLQEPLQVRLRRHAVDELNGWVFLEYVMRFTMTGGRPMRLEEVAVQTWEQGLIVEERFYYDGFVDEGD